MFNLQNFILIISELLFPILGFFFWSWNIVDICLFFSLDLILNYSIFVYINFKIKLLKINSNKIKIFKVLFLLIIIHYLSFVFFQKKFTNFNFYENIKHFLFLKDLGMAQIYFLIPLFILMFYMESKRNLIISKNYNSPELLNYKFILKKFIIIILLISVLIGIEIFIDIKDYLILIYILLSIFLFMTFVNNPKIVNSKPTFR